MEEISLAHCTLCPHLCSANRKLGQLGFCRLDAGLHIANISLHTGEEPIEGSEKGVCNVFFSHCNLRCCYCQNYQISQPQSVIRNEITDYETAVNQIVEILQSGVKFLGFVSPTSHIPQMLRIIEAVHDKGFFPKIIYNTNAYERVETLRVLEKYVDVYLPDFKYADESLAMRLSGIPNYCKTAVSAIREMYRQKQGVISDENPALIIRHLVLPNYIDNSLQVLQRIAEECSTKVFVSLMSQYFPVYNALKYNLIDRPLKSGEYDVVLKKLDLLGFERGWTQELESNDYYQPDFSKKNPFES